MEGEDDEMTAGQAMEQADEMRPNNEFSDSLKQNWLRQCDSRLLFPAYAGVIPLRWAPILR